MAIVSALLAACSHGTGEGNGVRPDPPPTPTPTPDPDPDPTPDIPSLDSASRHYLSTVKQEKTAVLTFRKANNLDITHRLTLDGETGTYSFSEKLPNGRKNLAITYSYGDESKSNEVPLTTYSGTLLVYQQPYSVVTGVTWMQGSGPGFKDDQLKLFQADAKSGFVTDIPTLLSLGARNTTFNYTGLAFDQAQTATLNYTMDFGNRKGHGSITGFANTGLIDLQAADLDPYGVVRGDAHFANISASEQDAQYEVSFFGPNAEEIVGNISERDHNNFLGKNEIIFAGKRATD